MNVDKAMEAAAAYLTFEQAGEPMFASEQVAVTLAAEVERLRAELAAAKAASVCPVEISALGDADWEYNVCVRCKSDDDANKLFDWLWERVEERVEG